MLGTSPGSRNVSECSYTSIVPMGQLGGPGEIGPSALDLASDASRYMTGATRVIGGGYALWS
jgi:gluconate 5-dehydrogenase